ncbi:MAG TPA: tyrosine-type recombinase/integrase, partial [Patescibacteria group bacterium]|nr:tyrosine-type recombinase/integrase [Patescibacteria group bacterium]
VISDRIIDELTNLLARTETGQYLFKGQKPRSHLSTRSAEKIFNAALLKSGIRKRATCHSLRHSFATHLLESGVDAVYIQKLLGHQRIETTLVYARISNKFINNIKSPL